MHNLEPFTRYRIMTIQLVVPGTLTDAEITDGANEILNAACMHPNTVVIDWKFENEMPVRCTGREPEEGDLFNPIPALTPTLLQSMADTLQDAGFHPDLINRVCDSVHTDGTF